MVVGHAPYGKGFYQEVLGLSKRRAIDITSVSKLPPHGRTSGRAGLRRGHGIQPNVVVRAASQRTGDPALATACARSRARVR